MTDPVTFHKKTIEIEGDRELYNYTFEIEPEGNLNEPEKNTDD